MFGPSNLAFLTIKTKYFWQTTYSLLIALPQYGLLESA
jgi:hypothetical protein